MCETEIFRFKSSKTSAVCLKRTGNSSDAVDEDGTWAALVDPTPDLGLQVLALLPVLSHV